MNYLKITIIFIASFIILSLIYYFFIIKKCKKNKKYVPIEVDLILVKHRIDYNKINLYQMIKVVSIVTIFIMSVVISLISELFSNTIMSLFIATIISIIIALLCYEMIGRYYKKKSL